MVRRKQLFTRILAPLITVIILVGGIVLTGTHTSAQAQSPGQPCPNPGQCAGEFLCTTQGGSSFYVYNEGCAEQGDATNPGEPDPEGSEQSGEVILPIGQQGSQALPGIPENYDPSQPQDAFSSWLARLINAAFILAALIVLFYLLWGAFEWITSGGDSSQLESARNRMTQAVIGLVVLASVFTIFGLLQDLLGFCVIDIAGSCSESGSGGGGLPPTPDPDNPGPF